MHGVTMKFIEEIIVQSRFIADYWHLWIMGTGKIWQTRMSSYVEKKEVLL